MTRGYRTEITGGARRQRGGGCGRGAVRARALGGGVWECAGPAMGFESLCEHHMLPFHGRVMAVVAVREGAGNAEETWAAVESAVEKYACRLQIQERLTEQVAEEVMGVEGAEGCVVVVDSAHMCMVARGVERFAASTVTSAYRGVYAADARARSAAVGRLLE